MTDPAGLDGEGRLQALDLKPIKERLAVGGVFGHKYVKQLVAEVERLRSLVSVPAAPPPQTEPMNLRMFKHGETFYIRGCEGSGAGPTPEAAMRELVRYRNTHASEQWPVAPPPQEQEKHDPNCPDCINFDPAPPQEQP